MKKICLVTGGTGGHIYPALALADIWMHKDPEVLVSFIGNKDRMEASIIPEAGYPFYGLDCAGLEGSIAHKMKAVLSMATAFLAARKILKKEKPGLVMGFGGYVSAPVLKAAQSLGIPTMIHEQNSVVGKANKLVMKDAKGIVICYEKCLEVFEKSKTRLLGNPRASIAAAAKKDEQYFRSLGLDPNKKTVLIVMGSLGSSSINELMKEALQGLDDDLQIVYVCGKQNDKDLNLFHNLPNVHVVSYVETMRLYKMLDGMVCRAGATTLAEATALGIPMVIIPSPYVANNHQYYNARMLTEKHAALMIEEKNLNSQSLKKGIQTAFINEHNRRKLCENARKQGRPDAAKDIIEFAEEIMESSRR